MKLRETPSVKMKKGAEHYRDKTAQSGSSRRGATSHRPRTPASHLVPRPVRPQRGHSLTYPMGFPALWNSFRTRSTSLFTLQSFPSTANVLLQQEETS